MSFSYFLNPARKAIGDSVSPARRRLFRSDAGSASGDVRLADYICGKMPTFYVDLRELEKAVAERDTCFQISAALERIPDSRKFQESHLGEVLAALFVEDVLKLRLVYSKLSLLSTSNSNAYKGDLLCFEPNSDPVQFWVGETKISHKATGQHAGSLYSDLFSSMRNYGSGDLRFDLEAAKDRIQVLNPLERERVREALKPYSPRQVKFLGLLHIDFATFDDDDIKIIITRTNPKAFDVDLVCYDGLSTLTDDVYKCLDSKRRSG